MVSVALKISDVFKAVIDELPWVNWSELAREEIIKDIGKSKKLEKILKIVSKSKLTVKDAELLSDKAKASMHKKLKKDGLI